MKPGHAKNVECTHYNTGKMEQVSDVDHPLQLASTPNYDILMNSSYRHKMHYVPSWWLDRLSYIATPKYELISGTIQMREDNYEGNIYSKTELDNGKVQKYTILAAKAQSDYVRMIVDLAYMPVANLEEIRAMGGLTTHGLLQYTYKRTLNLSLSHAILTKVSQKLR